MNNGRECVDEFKLNSGGYDLILLDIDMPVMNGLEACRLIREYEKAEKLHRLPVIVVSGHSIQSTHSECLEAGVDGSVPKPIDFAVLQKVLYGAIDPSVKFQLSEGTEGGWF